MAKHMPMPFAVESAGQYVRTRIAGDGGFMVAECSDPHGGSASAIADRMALAWNVHDQLAASLRELVKANRAYDEARRAWDGELSANGRASKDVAARFEMAIVERIEKVDEAREALAKAGVE